MEQVKQVLDKGAVISPHTHTHTPVTLHPPSASLGGGDRLGAALVGLESGSTSQAGQRAAHPETRHVARERDPHAHVSFQVDDSGGSSRAGQLGGGGGGSGGSGRGVGANSGGRWLLNPEGIGGHLQAAVKDLEVRGVGGGMGGARHAAARSPSPLSDSNDGGASLEERKERRR